MHDCKGLEIIFEDIFNLSKYMAWLMMASLPLGVSHSCWTPLPDMLGLIARGSTFKHEWWYVLRTQRQAEHAKHVFTISNKGQPLQTKVQKLFIRPPAR